VVETKEFYEVPGDLKTFFESLLELRSYAEEKAFGSKRVTDRPIWFEVYERLESILKEKQ
jgi:hypothetical protein